MHAYVLTVALAAAAQAPLPGASESDAIKHTETPERVAEGYHPQLYWQDSDITLSAPLELWVDGHMASALPVDTSGNTMEQATTLLPRLRLGFALNTGRALQVVNLTLDYQHELTQTLTGDVPQWDGHGYLPSTAETALLRKAWARAAFGPWLQLGGGVTTSHWGLGLISNQGNTAWKTGEGRFYSPKAADRLLRGQISSLMSQEHGLLVAINADRVLDDDALLTARELGLDSDQSGDRATQVSAAIYVGYEQTSGMGVYVAHRQQGGALGGETDAWVADVTARHASTETWGSWSVAGELAWIGGTTSLAANPQFPKQDIEQLGAALSAKLMMGSFGAVIDGVLATGDQNVDDGYQHGFRADPNFQLGSLLFEHVGAAQSARSYGTASDPGLVGYPSHGLERFPTRGSITNTLAFFPRAVYQPSSSVELYGGPMVAFRLVDPIDPLNSRLAGGANRNALGGKPGTLLGTELDVGIRYRVGFGTSELLLGAEGAYLIPCSAFVDASGDAMAPVYGARASLAYRL